MSNNSLILLIGLFYVVLELILTDHLTLRFGRDIA